MHESESEVAESCGTLSDPMDCSPPGSSIHGIFQARVLEWGAIVFSNIKPMSIQNLHENFVSMHFFFKTKFGLIKKVIVQGKYESNSDQGVIQIPFAMHTFLR